ncbi:MAG: hypothetical protein ACFFDS_02485 [Candidatus Thorarchaeota archaeon]
MNISEDDLEQVNQFLVSLETIVNEGRLWEIESIIEGEGLEGVIQAFLSMIITNFDQSLAKFRVYPRFIKKLENGKIRIHSSTRISSTESVDITWTLKKPRGEFQKLVIESINSMTVAIYEESKQERNEIPRLDEKWKGFMRAVEKVDMINRIYMKLKEEQGKTQAKAFFDDTKEFEQEVDNLFGFLEGPFRFIAYIAVMGSNVDGLKGVILKKNGDYEVVFDDFRELDALDSLTSTKKMTEKEYVDLLTYQWKQRTKKSKLLVEIIADKEKKRITYKITKKIPTTKKGKKLVKGERTRTTKKK